jgi:hypothetical protein
VVTKEATPRRGKRKGDDRLVGSAGDVKRFARQRGLPREAATDE